MVASQSLTFLVRVLLANEVLISPLECVCPSDHVLICTLRVLPTSFYKGFDGAGVVAALGPGVVKFKVGDWVYVTKSTTGTYATHCIAETAHVR